MRLGLDMLFPSALLFHQNSTDEGAPFSFSYAGFRAKRVGLRTSKQRRFFLEKFREGFCFLGYLASWPCFFRAILRTYVLQERGGSGCAGTLAGRGDGQMGNESNPAHLAGGFGVLNFPRNRLARFSFLVL